MMLIPDGPLWAYEWTGACLGLAGAGLLSLNVKASRFGWPLFLLSNMAWIVYGIRTEMHGLVAMQIGFTITSLVGAYRWLATRKV
jgi:hypothetical protein